MKNIVWILVGIVALVPLVLAVWYFYVRHRIQKAMAEKYHRVAPLLQQLTRKQPVTRVQIEEMARDPGMRHATFRVLEAYGQSALFPLEHATVEKGAESYLVTWLEFPTELGRAPDEIELIRAVTLEETTRQIYYVFRFRMVTPHWSTKFNWMIGVVGPYSEESEAFDMPAKIFSRFNTVADTIIEDEVQWVHANVV